MELWTAGEQNSANQRQDGKARKCLKIPRDGSNVGFCVRTTNRYAAFL